MPRQAQYIGSAGFTYIWGYPRIDLAPVVLSSTSGSGVPFNTYVNQQNVVYAYDDEATGVPT